MEKQVKSGGIHPLGPATTKKDEKEKKLLEAKEMAALFRPVQSQKIDKGTDPKSVVCAFFKAGQCGKGDKCKFSHDLAVERKVEKRSLYVDMRDDEDGDTMENWNEEKLKEVVDTKQNMDKRTMPPTDIVSMIIDVLLQIFKRSTIFVIKKFAFHVFRYANSFWKRLKNQNTDGFGSVRMVNDVYIATHFQWATY